VDTIFSKRMTQLINLMLKFFTPILLEKLGCAPQKINVIPIAIRLGIYPFRQRKPKGKKELKSILFCGSFREKKGILDALETVRRVFEKGENIEFRIIGDGELRSQIEEYIDNNNMRSYTNLLGFQSHDRMIDEMNAADIFFHPSCTAANGDGEGGAPTTILEAQACGLPVLSTTHDDIPNIVVPGESALLASEHDIDRLSYLLKSLLSQPERWGNMGISGRSFVEKKHDVKSVIQSLEDLYYSLNEN